MKLARKTSLASFTKISSAHCICVAIATSGFGGNSKNTSSFIGNAVPGATKEPTIITFCNTIQEIELSAEQPFVFASNTPFAQSSKFCCFSKNLGSCESC
jgi:hypothetical protein